jgi:hypothetical protein
MDPDNKHFLLPNEYINLEGQKSYCYISEEIDDITLEKKLRIVYAYNLPLDPNFIKLLETNNCKILEFGSSFNYPIDNLPNCIESINFPIYSEFNQPINNLPSSLNSLHLPQYFNQPIDNLPPNLKTLCIQEYFNQSIDCLPIGLEYLEIKGNFNQPINNLPSSLKSLIIKDQDTSITNWNNLYSLHSKFNQTLDNLPEYLEYLEVSNKYFMQKINILPKNLKVLSLHNDYIDKIKLIENLKQKYPHLDMVCDMFSNDPNKINSFILYLSNLTKQ